MGGDREDKRSLCQVGGTNIGVLIAGKELASKEENAGGIPKDNEVTYSTKHIQEK